jgi:N,N'-diacetyllegionaminate synthase
MKETDILIGQKVIGSGSQVFVIAEIGINHNGSPSQAEKLIDAAAASGADAVEFSSYQTDRLLIPSRDRYLKQPDGSESTYQTLRRCELSLENQEKLKRHADKRDILFMSTPFDEESVDSLDSLDVLAFKVASSDITHMPLLRHIASKGKPVFLSTGMSFLSEVADAVWTLRSAGAKEILLMHCVSSCPALPQHMNLRALQTMQSHFELPVGLSDHSEGILLAPVAVALGAVVLEKHFTLDKNAPGRDQRASMDPVDLKEMVRNLRNVEASLGDGRKRPSDVEEESRLFKRRSIVAAVDIREHEKIAQWMLAFKQPGSGLEPRYSEKIAGMTARRNIGKDTILQWEDLAPSSFSETITANAQLERDAEYLQESTPWRHHA